jgi:hypothetical protein
MNLNRMAGDICGRLGDRVSEAAGSTGLMIKRILPILLASVAPAHSASVAIHPYECHQEIERNCAVGCAELICAAPPARSCGCGSGSLASAGGGGSGALGASGSLGSGIGGSSAGGGGGSNTGGGGLSEGGGALLAQPVLPSRLEHRSRRKATPASRLLCRWPTHQVPSSALDCPA